MVKSESQEKGEFFGGPKSTYRVGLVVEFEIAALIPTGQVNFNHNRRALQRWLPFLPGERLTDRRIFANSIGLSIRSSVHLSIRPANEVYNVRQKCV